MVINHNLKRLKSTIFVLISALLLIVYFNKISNADIKPNDKFSPQEVVEIQLTSLQNNSINNLGIYQCWLFAHPDNKKYTGPLDRFKRMLKGASYSMLIDHKENTVTEIYKSSTMATYEVVVLDKDKQYFKFKWKVEKNNKEGNLLDCWLTTAVSQPIPMGSSI